MKPKPCPFCGGDAVIHCNIPRLHDYGYGVGCGNPDCLAYSGYGMVVHDTKEEAVAAWNRRASLLDTIGEMHHPDAYEVLEDRYSLLLEKAIEMANENKRLRELVQDYDRELASTNALCDCDFAPLNDATHLMLRSRMYWLGIEVES